jgi:hypothetical protein
VQHHYPSAGEFEAAIDAYHKSFALKPSSRPLARISALKKYIPEDPDIAEMEVRMFPESSNVHSREGDPKGWSTVLVTVLGSWEKAVPHGHHSLFPECSLNVP